MSIVETKVVDIIAVPEWEPENVILVITDHLEWGDKAQQGEHLLLLQEKINTYIAFIESGEILESYPHLAEDDIRACLAYASELLREEKVYPLNTA